MGIRRTMGIVKSKLPVWLQKVPPHRNHGNHGNHRNHRNHKNRTYFLGHKALPPRNHDGSTDWE
eukprot:11578128-Karenia_brevis.AAC.1